MLHGNISNQRSYVIGFRCENSLLKYKGKTPLDVVANLIRGKTHRAELNPAILSLMNYVYWNTEYTVVLVIDNKNYTDEAKRYFENLPYNQVVNVLKSISEVTMMLNTGELTYYVSDDILDRQNINSEYAVSSEQFNSILRRKVLRP